jgi:hypothetical protein
MADELDDSAQAELDRQFERMFIEEETQPDEHLEEVKEYLEK